MGRGGSGGDQDGSRDNPDLRVAEVVKLDIHVDEGGAVTYRAKIQLSVNYEPEH